MQEEIIKCSCGKEFVWSVRDQEFYAEKGFVRPRSCRECREAKKSGNTPVRNFTNNNDSNYKEKKGFNSRDAYKKRNDFGFDDR